MQIQRTDASDHIYVSQWPIIHLGLSVLLNPSIHVLECEPIPIVMAALSNIGGVAPSIFNAAKFG